VLRRQFGPKREEVTEGCKKLHDEELRNYTLHQMLLSEQAKRMKWMGYVG
jgi:hypothetical protein